MAQKEIPGEVRTRWGEVRAVLADMYTELYPKRSEITDQGTPIVFTTAIPIGVEFEVFPVSCMNNGDAVAVNFSDITRFGFTATSAEPNATLIYQVLTF